MLFQICNFAIWTTGAFTASARAHKICAPALRTGNLHPKLNTKIEQMRPGFSKFAVFHIPPSMPYRYYKKTPANFASLQICNDTRIGQRYHYLR